jgi:hypothetical protein
MRYQGVLRQMAPVFCIQDKIWITPSILGWAWTVFLISQYYGDNLVHIYLDNWIFKYPMARLWWQFYFYQRFRCEKGLDPQKIFTSARYVFEKFSLQVASDQLRFYGHPTQAEEDWKQEVWPPNKMYDSMSLDNSVASGEDGDQHDGKKCTCLF